MTPDSAQERTPRAQKRPERGIWQGGRLSAKKSEAPSQQEPTITSSSPTRQPAHGWDASPVRDGVPNSEVQQHWQSEKSPTRSVSSSPVRQRGLRGWDTSPVREKSESHAPVDRGRTEEKWRSVISPTRSTSSSPVRQQPSTGKPEPYKISFWWAPSPTPNATIEASASPKETFHRESSPKPESMYTAPSKSDSPNEPESNRDSSSKPEPINVIARDASTSLPKANSSSPIESNATYRNRGNSLKPGPTNDTVRGLTKFSSLSLSSPRAISKQAYGIVCGNSFPIRTPPKSYVSSTNEAPSKRSTSPTTRSATSPQPHHPSTRPRSPESTLPMASAHPSIQPQSPEPPIISLAEIPHSSTSSSSTAVDRTPDSPVLRFVHPLPPKPSPPPKPSLESLQATNPYSKSLASSASLVNPKPVVMASPPSSTPNPGISPITELKVSGTLRSPPSTINLGVSQNVDFKFTGDLRPPPSTSKPGDAYGLISRSGPEEKSRLLSTGAQMGLFVWIRQELAAVRKLTDSRDESDEKMEKERIGRLQHLVETIRKLREAVLASNKLDDFAVEVYELSVSTCLIQPAHREELQRSLRVLCDFLYQSVPACKNQLRYRSIDLLARLPGDVEDIAEAHRQLLKTENEKGMNNEQLVVADAVLDIQSALACGDYVGFANGCKLIRGSDLGELVKDLLPHFRAMTLDVVKRSYLFIPIHKLAGYMLLDPEQHAPCFMPPTPNRPRWKAVLDFLDQNGIDTGRCVRDEKVYLREKLFCK